MKAATGHRAKDFNKTLEIDTNVGFVDLTDHGSRLHGYDLTEWLVLNGVELSDAGDIRSKLVPLNEKSTLVPWPAR